MKAFPIVLAAAWLVLPSCESLSSAEYTPEYLKESSPLDPPGTETVRNAMRQQRVKEGKYEPGTTLSVQQGRVFLLNRNPEYDPEAGGRLVEAESAQLLSCEGIYYFVEMSDGKRGYLRESDFIDPWMQEPAQEEPTIQLEENQTLATNEHGRSVVLVGRKSERAAEFERRRKAVESGTPLPEPAPAGDEPPPLPEPAGDAPQE